MKISYNWIKQFIKTDWTAEQTSELLTDLGLEVEGLDLYQSVKGAHQRTQKLQRGKGKKNM